MESAQSPEFDADLGGGAFAFVVKAGVVVGEVFCAVCGIGLGGDFVAAEGAEAGIVWGAIVDGVDEGSFLWGGVVGFGDASRVYDGRARVETP